VLVAQSMLSPYTSCRVAATRVSLPLWLYKPLLTNVIEPQLSDNPQSQIFGYN